MELREFIWVGKNKYHNSINVSWVMNTSSILSGNYPTFYSLHNREKDGNCDFMFEIEDGDYMRITFTGIDDFTIFITFVKDVAYCSGGKFKNVRLETVLNDKNFISAELLPF